MGYSTSFKGSFALDKNLTNEQLNYLRKFAETKRFKRDVNKLVDMPDPIREAVNLPLGEDGSYFVGGTGFFGQDHDSSVILENHMTVKPTSQPGYWCQWTPNDDGDAIKWDGGEKFYNYIEWIEYIIEHFLNPWGYKVNGSVSWRGDDREDRGKIHVENNVVTIEYL